MTCKEDTADVFDPSLQDIFRKREPVADGSQEHTGKIRCTKSEDAGTARRPLPDKNSVKNCAKAILPFGALNMLIWYWMTAGLMAESIAIPCTWVCVALAGYGTGKALR